MRTIALTSDDAYRTRTRRQLLRSAVGERERYLLNPGDIVGETFEQGSLQVFPIVYLGWQF